MYLGITHILYEHKPLNVLCSYPVTHVRVLESPSSFVENTMDQASAKGEVLQ